MTEEYRQKLLNWFCSIGILLIACALLPMLYWTVFFPQWKDMLGVTNHPARLESLAGPFGEQLLLYPLLFPIFLFWHFWDFIQKGQFDSIWASRLSQHRLFFWTMTAGIAIFLLMSMGFFQYNSCDELDGAFYFQCIVRPADWIMALWVIIVGFALVLCISKAILSIRSRFAKDQSARLLSWNRNYRLPSQTALSYNARFMPRPRNAKRPSQPPRSRESQRQPFCAASQFFNPRTV